MRLAALIVAAVTASCAHNDQSDGKQRQPESGYRQVDRGANQTFVACVGDCPKPTQKTYSVPERLESREEPKENTGEPEQSERHLAKNVSVTIYFDTDKADVRKSEEIKVGTLCQSIKGGDQITVSGRTDSTGSEKHNATLAKRRADTVAGFIKECAKEGGADVGMNMDYRGACCYVQPNSTEQGRQANRRVEVDIVRGVKPTPSK